MPIYLYKNKDSGEIKEIFQSMNEPHIYQENGKQWDRVWVSPNACIDGNVNPFSQQQFLDKTRTKGETIGGVMDRAKELSEKRKQKEGIDKTQQKWFKEYSDKRKGRKHPLDN